jgi:hypothetical protein
LLFLLPVVAVGAISLWQLARFRCGSWRVFVVAVGAFSLWQLAHFRCGSWRIFVVAVGAFSLWQLAQLIVFRSMFVI